MQGSHDADGSDTHATKTLRQPASSFFEGLSRRTEPVRSVPMKHRSLSLARFAGTVLSTVAFRDA